jgi:transposase
MEGATMEQIIARCCGLDVHHETVAACVRVPGPSGKRIQHLKTFGTTLADLLALRDWLEAHEVTHVAMESTGVYWKPVYYVLEERVTCLLVNAAHLKRVPGRKTDLQDCAWIASIEADLVRLAQPLPAYALLRTIPGVGPTLAAILLVEIGDIAWYTKFSQLRPLSASGGGHVLRCGPAQRA